MALRVTESEAFSVQSGRIFLDLWSYSHLSGNGEDRQDPPFALRGPHNIGLEK